MANLTLPACNDFECEVVVINSNFKLKKPYFSNGADLGLVYMKVDFIKEKVKYIRDIESKVYQGYR